MILTSWWKNIHRAAPTAS